jgi:AcrR family transcriptional regulator
MRTKDYGKVEVIFEAGLDLISSEGIAGLTMKSLAARSGMATGTLYIYFRSKEELFQRMYIYYRNRSLERFMQGYDPSEPFRIGLKKVYINYLTHRIEHHSESIFLEQYYRSSYITEEQNALAEAMKHPVYEVIQRGKREQLIKNDVDDEMLFLAMLGFVRELADEHVTKQYKMTPERIEKAFQLTWDMIRM